MIFLRSIIFVGCFLDLERVYEMADTFKNVLLLTTSFPSQTKSYLNGFNIHSIEQKIKAIGFNDLVDLGDESSLGLSTFDVDVILCDENETLDHGHKEELKKYLQGKPVIIHFVTHHLNIEENEAWVADLSEGRYFKRYERSANGICFEFLSKLANYRSEGKNAEYCQALDLFFKNSKEISLELGKQEILNKWGPEQFGALSESAIESFFRESYHRQLLLAKYPKISDYFQKFRHHPKPEGLMLEKLALADYLYSS